MLYKYILLSSEMQGVNMVICVIYDLNSGVD